LLLGTTFEARGQRPKPSTGAEPPAGEPPAGEVGPPGPPSPAPPGIREEELWPERDDFSERFPSREGGARKRARRAEEARPRAAAEEVRAAPSVAPDLCANLDAEDRLNCPLDRQGPASRVETIPGGTRIWFGKQVDAGRLQRSLDCQRRAAQDGPQAPSTCPLLGPTVGVKVGQEKRGVFVELTEADEGAASVLRERVKTAFPAEARPGAGRPGGGGAPARSPR
jgi:hypothetical protein